MSEIKSNQNLSDVMNSMDDKQVSALIASGALKSELVNEYIKNVDLFMVATGINFNNDFYNIDPNKLNKLMNVIENDGENYEHR